VPPDMLCYPNLCCGWTDYCSHQALAPVWSLPTCNWTSEYPISRLAVVCVVAPHLESRPQT